jgi:hypothetical protein
MVVNMEKRADPTKKERLVASKKSWNAAVKLLIAKLIAFKRAINGNGDPDAQLPEVDLKEPFPVEFHTYLESIIDDYNKVVKGADFVMDLQDDFSVTRRKSRKELHEVAASIDNQDQLEAQASWVGSRAWAWFSLYRLGRDVRRVRLRMLSIVRKSIHALNTIEYNFTSKSPGSDVRAVVGLTKFVNLYIGGYLYRLAQLQQIDRKGLEAPPQLPEGKPREEGEGELPPEPGPEDVGEEVAGGPVPESGPDVDIIEAQAKGGILDNRIKRILSSSYDSNQKTVITSQFKRLQDALAAKKRNPELIIDIYKNLVDLIVQAEGSPEVKSASTEEEEYRKIAQNVIQRWWSRQMLGSSPTDELKKLISDEIRDTVKALNELMDVIENVDRSTADIQDSTDKVSTMLKSVAEHTLRFADDYRMAWRMEADPKQRPARLEKSITATLKELIKIL